METKHGKSHGGKGSLPRPTNQQKYADNWERIFGKKKDDKKELDVSERSMMD